MTNQIPITQNIEIKQEYIKETLSLQAKTIGFFTNFVMIVSQRFKAFFNTAMGQYQYIPKNRYTTNQKEKILKYLQAKVLTLDQKIKEFEPSKFLSYDPDMLKGNRPEDLKLLR